MGLRRTTFRSLITSSSSSRRPGSVGGPGGGGGEAAVAVSPSQGKAATAEGGVGGGGGAEATVDESSPVTSSSSSSRATTAASTTGKIAAETAAAATKPLRERGQQSAKARLARKAALAAPSPAPSSTTTTTTTVVADPPQDPQDGMAPALTEPTAVPTAAQTKTDSSSASPQPEIFEGGAGGFADTTPLHHHHLHLHHQPMAAGDAEEAVADGNMGHGAGAEQARPPKRSKREELPLKELRSSRRRSNLPAGNTSNTTSPAAVVEARQTNGKSGGKQRWTTGGNGGVVKGRTGGGGVEEAASPSKSITSNSSGSGGRAEKEKGRQPAETNGGGADVNMAKEEQQPDEVVEGEKKRVEPSSAEATADEEKREEEVANNNNYLDKNRVPIMTSSAVKDEGPAVEAKQQEEKPLESPVTNAKDPESNSGTEPVTETVTTTPSDEATTAEGTRETTAPEGESGEQQQEQESGEKVAEVKKEDPQEENPPLPSWNTPNGDVGGAAPQLHLLMPPPSAASSSTSVPMADEEQLQANDAALLEQLVLTTPTKKLTEQLCMVLKDQERALEQQEQQEAQQQQQQQQSVSNPSSQTMLKESAEMEQMLGDLAATSELDLLQVFKSFEGGGPAADDAVAAGAEGNLLSLLGADDDVDMMIVSPVKAPRRVPAVDHEAQEIVERQRMLTEMEQELSQMQRRRDFLLRRLRKQQVQHMGRHLSEEVVGLFELSARANAASGGAAHSKGVLPVGTQKALGGGNKYLKGGAEGVAVVTSPAAEVAKGEDVEEMTPACIVIRNESPSPMMKERREQSVAVGHHPFIKPPSPKTIRTFVQKVKVMAASTAAGAVAAAVAEPQTPVSGVMGRTSTPVAGSTASFYATGNHHHHCRGSTPSGSAMPKMRPGLLPLNRKSTLDDGHRLQLANNVGLLRTELRITEQAIDSEATASSSGGESADELINYSNSVQETLAIANRAAWRWAQERARLASRWNWLTAEISDLEYRIRQHTELHNQLRKSKGPVLLLRPQDKGEGAAAQRTDPLSPTAPASVNGYRGLLPGQYSSTKSYDAAAAADGFMADVENELEGTASRTRPFQRTAFKRRKLVQTMNLHTISKKAARPSSIKCGCQWPQQPCALCTGRCDPTIPRPLPDMIPRLQRAALLDPCLHSCLSFPEGE